MGIPFSCLLALSMGLCLPAAQPSTAPAAPDAIEPLPVSDPVKAMQLLDAMSADEVARYLTDPKTHQFGWALTALRRKGEAAIPHLVKLMGRDDLGRLAWRPMMALVGLGDKGLPPLVELLKGDDQTARRRAAWALSESRRPCKDAIAPLIEILKSNDKAAVGHAACALALNGKDAADAVPYLIPLAFKHNPGSYVRAIDAIGLDPSLIPSVIERLAGANDREISERLRLWAGARLLGATDTNGAAALAKAMVHRKVTVRLAAARAIAKLGKQVKTDAVEKALRTAIADDATRVDAAAALVAIGASAKGAVPGLIRDLELGRVSVLATTNLRYECRAAEVLTLIPEAVPALMEGLGSHKQMIRIGCVWAMPADAATAKRVVPKIKALLARSASQREQELIVMKLYQLAPKWVRQVSTGLGPKTRWPPRHWHQVTQAVVASVKAEARPAAE